ncbi:NAD-dependent epimerase/dehydratase family protein [Rhodococcus sp. 3Y1]
MALMKLLMLGGTRFLGHALVDAALARGWEVTVLHRGLTGAPPPTAEVLFADRTDQRAMVDALGDRRWDLVVDTWSGSPRVIGKMRASYSVTSTGTHTSPVDPSTNGACT